MAELESFSGLLAQKLESLHEIAIQKLDENDDDAEDGEVSNPTITKKDSWSSKLSYLLTLVGFAGVSFGTIWRFPSLMQQNGGIAFLIPYIVMMIICAIPMFFLELSVGQRRQRGIIYAWNEVCPAFGGMGITCSFICFFVALYYNTLTSYGVSYFVDSFINPLPWANCDGIGDSGQVKECKEYLLGKSTKFYWNRHTLGISDNIETSGGYSFYLFGYLIVVWLIIWLILVKGMKIIAKMVYFTSTFPYIVLLIFFIMNCAIEPAKGWLGAYRLLKPDWYSLIRPNTWVFAGSQVFFALGLGVGILVVFASYSPPKNDCFKDAIYIGIINCVSCIFAALVVFPMIGRLGYRNYEICFDNMKKIFPGMSAKLTDHYDIYFVTNASDWINISSETPVLARYGYGVMTYKDKMNLDVKRSDEEKYQRLTNYTNSSVLGKDFEFSLKDCSILQEATASGSGPGFIFVSFTEQILQIDGSNFWCALFFFMLILLGINSGFAMVEVTVNAMVDLTHLTREWASGIICCASMILGLLLFPFGNGFYILFLLDQFLSNWSVLLIAIMECISVAWIYGLAQIAYDCRLMTGKVPNLYILLCWKFITPIVIVVLLLGSIIQFSILAVKNGGLYYTVFQPKKSEERTGTLEMTLPGYSLAAVFLLLLGCMMWLPIQAILRKTKYKLLKEEQLPGLFPEEELREELNIFVEKEEDQFTSTEKRIMGEGSLHILQSHRDSIINQSRIFSRRGTGSSRVSGASSVDSKPATRRASSTTIEAAINDSK